jgi:hypothetical protein
MARKSCKTVSCWPSESWGGGGKKSGGEAREESSRSRWDGSLVAWKWLAVKKAGQNCIQQVKLGYVKGVT